MTKQTAAKIANGIATQYAVTTAKYHKSVSLAEQIGVVVYCVVYDSLLAGGNAEDAATFAVCFFPLRT